MIPLLPAKVLPVFGALMVQGLTQIGYRQALFFIDPERQWVLTMWATSVATQTMGTLLIAYRQLSTPVYVSSTKSSRYCSLTAVTCAVVDSGAIYTLVIMVTLALYVRQGAEGAVVGAILGQIAVGSIYSPRTANVLTLLGNRPADYHRARVVENYRVSIPARAASPT